MDTTDNAAGRFTTARSAAGPRVVAPERGRKPDSDDDDDCDPPDERRPPSARRTGAPDASRPASRTAAADRGWFPLRRDGSGSPRPLAVVMLAVVSAQTFLWTFHQVQRHDPDSPSVSVYAVVLVALFGIQLYLWTGALTGRGRWDRWPWVTIHGVLAGLPLLVVGDAWLAVPGFFIGTVLLSLPRPQAWAAAGCLVVAVAGAAYALGADGIGIGLTAMSATAVALVVYGVVRLAHAVDEMRTTRAALARSAVAQERRRIGRDLHDLLGHSLSAVVLRGELALRLWESAPEAAKRELGEVIAAARRAVADLRGVVSRTRRPSFEAEVSAARAVLQAAGIECRATVRCGRIPEPTSVMLGWVVREAVTNVLNHSHADVCVIDAVANDDQVQLTISNNGVGRPAPTSAAPHGGSGLRNLRERIELAGGTLTTPLAPGEWFQLTAVLPIRARHLDPTLSAAARF